MMVSGNFEFAVADFFGVSKLRRLILRFSEWIQLQNASFERLGELLAPCKLCRHQLNDVFRGRGLSDNGDAFIGRFTGSPAHAAAAWE
jgi:hypothetical protein